MQAPAAHTLIKVRLGPKYARDLEQLSRTHPSLIEDVRKVVDETIKPAVTKDPIEPHKQNGGTPIVQGTLHIRVPDGGSGKSGGFRLLYHWNRHTLEITLLRIDLRKNVAAWPRPVVLELLKAAQK